MPSGGLGTGSGRGSCSTAEIAASRWRTARTAAAAGLLSSCARPAAIVPSEASFSRSRSVASSCRRRATAVRMMASATSGPAASRSRTASTGMRSTSASVTASTEASLRPPSSAAISPCNEPGPTRATGMSALPDLLVTSSSPASTTYSASARSPSPMSRVPAGRSTTSPIPTSRSQLFVLEPAEERRGPQLLDDLCRRHVLVTVGH